MSTIGRNVNETSQVDLKVAHERYLSLRPKFKPEKQKDLSKNDDATSFNNIYNNNTFFILFSDSI